MFHVLVLQMAMSFGGGASEMHTTPWGTPRWACGWSHGGSLGAAIVVRFPDDGGADRWWQP